MVNKKWKFVRRLNLCKCGMCFRNRESFNEHLRDTIAYRKYHYAPDYTEIPFTIWEYKLK